MPDADPADTDPTARLVAIQLGLALPPECIAGVRENLAVLADHWASLRRVLEADTA